VAQYEWHAELSVASFGLIHHFEVLLSNAIDHALGAGQPRTPIKDTWLLDFESLQPDGIKQVVIAIKRPEKAASSPADASWQPPWGRVRRVDATPDAIRHAAPELARCRAHRSERPIGR
jgi:hypothetical protein